MRFNYHFNNKKGMMPYKYDNGKIYKIVSDNTDDIYIGSTTNTLKQRLQEHESKYRKNNLGLKACDILKFGSYRIELIQDFPCNNRCELYKREGEIQKEHKNCINYFIAGRDNKQYYIDNVDKIKQRTSEWQKKNNVRRRAAVKKSYEKNKHKKVYNVCECGGTYTGLKGQHRYIRHSKTKKHQDYFL